MIRDSGLFLGHPVHRQPITKCVKDKLHPFLYIYSVNFMFSSGIFSCSIISYSLRLTARASIYRPDGTKIKKTSILSKLRYAPVVTEASFGERMTHAEKMD